VDIGYVQSFKLLCYVMKQDIIYQISENKCFCYLWHSSEWKITVKQIKNIQH